MNKTQSIRTDKALIHHGRPHQNNELQQQAQDRGPDQYAGNNYDCRPFPWLSLILGFQIRNFRMPKVRVHFRLKSTRSLHFGFGNRKLKQYP